MSNPLIRASDHYVLLEPDSKEKIVSKQEAILWLKNWLSKTETQTIYQNCLLYTSPSPRDLSTSRMPSSA